MCKDKSVKTLNGLGYSPIKLPKSDEYYYPLLWICRQNGGLSRIGRLSNIVQGSAPMPAITPNQAVASISGLSTGQIELGLGLSFLEDILNFFSAQTIKLDAAFKNAKNIEFTYVDVLDDSVFPVELGNYLQKEKPNGSCSYFNKVQEQDQSFIITEILKSKSLKIAAYNESNVKLDLDLGAIKKLLNIAPKVNVQSVDSKTISFSGDKYLAFAFKAICLWVEKNSSGDQFFKFSPERDAGPLRLAATPPESNYIYFLKNEPVEISEI